MLLSAGSRITNTLLANTYCYRSRCNAFIFLKKNHVIIISSYFSARAFCCRFRMLFCFLRPKFSRKSAFFLFFFNSGFLCFMCSFLLCLFVRPVYTGSNQRFDFIVNDLKGIVGILLHPSGMMIEICNVFPIALIGLHNRAFQKFNLLWMFQIYTNRICFPIAIIRILCFQFTMNIVRLIKGKVHQLILKYLKAGKTIWIFCLDSPSAFLFKTKSCSIFSRIHKNFFDVCTNFTFFVCG